MKRLRRVCGAASIACVLLGILLALTAFSRSPRFAYHYVIILDTSRSMVGEGSPGAKNIFQDVKAASYPFIDKFLLSDIPEAPTHVFLYTFDQGLRSRADFVIHNQEDKARLRTAIEALQAKGDWTYINSSLRAIFDQVYSTLRSVPVTAPDQHVVNFYLFTDGQDNSQPPVRFDNLLQEFRLKRSEAGSQYDFLFYCKINLAFTDTEAAVIEGNKDVIAGVHQVQSPWQVKAEPPEFHLGNLWVSREALRDIHLECVNCPADRPASLHLNVDFQLPGGSFVSVSPTSIAIDTTVGLTFALTNAQNPDPLVTLNEWSGTLHIAPPSAPGRVVPDAIPVHFAFAPPCSLAVGSTANAVVLSADAGSWWGDRPTPITVVTPLRRNRIGQQRAIDLHLQLEPANPKDRTSPQWEYLASHVELCGQRGTEIDLNQSPQELSLTVAPRQQEHMKVDMDLRWSIQSNSATLYSPMKTYAADAGSKITVPVHVFLPKRPSPWWVKALIIAVIALVALAIGTVSYSFWRGENPIDVFARPFGRGALLHGSLVSVGGTAMPPIPLVGKRRVTLGRDRDALKEFAGEAVIFMESGEVKLQVVSGEVWRRTRGGEFDQPVYLQESLIDGDVVTFGPHKFEYRTDVVDYSRS